MKYKSTRGRIKNISFKETVLMGLADDGGLILPEFIPQPDLSKLRTLSYKELAFGIFKLFMTDIPEKDLKELIEKSYKNFDAKEVVNLVNLKDFYILELFYGSTLSFKDIALQFLGNLFEYILKEKNKKMNVLGATSGDTGSAAIWALKDKENIKVFILYPYQRVSQLQELQMTATESENIYPIAVKGTFDDCQQIVKELFSDLEFKTKYNLGAVNSINFARILAQTVYYFYSFFKSGKEEVYFSVPTGNFGNIFAGYLAKRMGLPIKKLILATNENDILTRFVNSGDYSVRGVIKTISPAMDIQVASNFERYLYYFYDENPEIIRNKMEEFKEKKALKFSELEVKKVQEDFISFSVNQKEALETIKEVYEKYNYLICPHTACGIKALLKVEDETSKISLATAHPAKFPQVYEKIGIKKPLSEKIEILKKGEKKFYILEADIQKIKEFIISKN